MQAAVISEQGRRWSMEDTHFLDLDFGHKGWVFGGVYDGHSGYMAAEHAARHLHQRFLGLLERDQEPEAAFKGAYEAISDELKYQDSGATAVTFFVRGNELTVANAGDSRALMISQHQVVQLTEDHRLDNPHERRRIARAGGKTSDPYVMKGFSGLMPTRSLGDAFFRDVGIIPTPYTRQYRIQGQELYLLAACDGLFDVMHNEEVARMARDCLDPQDLVQRLKQEVLEVRHGSDNLTILVLLLPEVDDDAHCGL